MTSLLSIPLRTRAPHFPHHGKLFSTLWKNIFHTVENSVFSLFLLVSLLLLAPRAFAAEPPATTPATADPARIFVAAAAAYDAGNLTNAIADWTSLLENGQTLAPVLYNLGNAHYRAGHLAPAILSWRRAQRLAPRDPDIRANLTFAAQTAGLTLPATAPLPALLLDLTRREWTLAATALYWLLTLTLALWILLPRTRPVTRPLALAFLLLLMLPLAGCLLHLHLDRTPECVVMTPAQLLSGPLETATPLLALPEGTLVRRLGTHGDWTEIRALSTRGWLPTPALTPVPLPNE